jgi:hypothetical protein
MDLGLPYSLVEGAIVNVKAFDKAQTPLAAFTAVLSKLLTARSSSAPQVCKELCMCVHTSGCSPITKLQAAPSTVAYPDCRIYSSAADACHVLLVQVPFATTTKTHALVQCSSGFGLLLLSAQARCSLSRLTPLASSSNTAQQQQQHAAHGTQHNVAARAPVRISSRRLSVAGVQALHTPPHQRQRLHLPFIL